MDARNDSTRSTEFDLDRPVFGVSDWCRITRVSRSWLMAHLDEIPHKRVGRFIRFSRRDCSIFLEQISRGMRGAA